MNARNHFLTPMGQPEMIHKNFTHRHLRIFVTQRSCMKLYASSVYAAPASESSR